MRKESKVLVKVGEMRFVSLAFGGEKNYIQKTRSLLVNHLKCATNQLRRSSQAYIPLETSNKKMCMSADPYIKLKTLVPVLVNFCSVRNTTQN